MPIIMRSNDVLPEDAFNAMKYPDPKKVLSGVLYGRNNEFQGHLDPKDYVKEYHEDSRYSAFIAWTDIHPS